MVFQLATADADPKDCLKVRESARTLSIGRRWKSVISKQDFQRVHINLLAIAVTLVFI